VTINVIGTVLGAALGALITVAIAKNLDRIDWRTVNKWITFATIPFTLAILGASWGHLSDGLIASVALLFGLSALTQFMAALGAWRADVPDTDEE
jgi:glycerol uptake facilitator-like aquaporin